MSFVETVDARGERCPMPILMAKRAIAMCERGDSIEVLATDPAAPSDFETFAKLEGHSVSWERREEVLAIALTLYVAGAGGSG
ncbi:sulfurtransferase TusA family protein [Luminiphilus sp.]|nr:sulfurtransferase TusA family protein [Luminiphilus sp.]